MSDENCNRLGNMATTMTPEPGLLPDVLPTDRLCVNGRPVPELREAFRRIPSVKNAVTVMGAYVQSFGFIALAIWIDRWWAYALAFLLMGRAFALYNILAHEAAHRLLFRRRGLNDFVGKWMLAYPAFNPFEVYRRAHMSHHRDALGPNEPDATLYARYPITRDSMRRKLFRDALFISGWKNMKPLFLALTKPNSRTIASRIVLVQLGIWACFAALGLWWAYPLLWLAPSMTVWRVLNRLRAIAEHGGMTRSADTRLTTHVVRQGWLARFWVVPYNTGWHLAHHVDMGIPWRNLPKLHDELVASGWVTRELEYPGYLTLWRALASRQAS